MPTVPCPVRSHLNSAVDDAQTSEPPAGIQPSPRSTTSVALLRLYSPTTRDHLYTTSVADRDNAVGEFGYADEGVTCHVRPN